MLSASLPALSSLSDVCDKDMEAECILLHRLIFGQCSITAAESKLSPVPFYKIMSPATAKIKREKDRSSLFYIPDHHL